MHRGELVNCRETAVLTARDTVVDPAQASRTERENRAILNGATAATLVAAVTGVVRRSPVFPRCMLPFIAVDPIAVRFAVLIASEPSTRMAPIHVTQQQKQHKGLLEQARFSLVRRAFYKSVVVTAASPGTHMGCYQSLCIGNHTDHAATKRVTRKGHRTADDHLK
jgi:hypothetical protein